VISASSINNAGTINSSGSLRLIADSIVNSGLIHSAGNLVLAPESGNSLSINASGGTFSTAGNINIVSQKSSPGDLISVTGGSFLSKQLNFDCGQGAVAAGLDRASGVVNVNAYSAQVGTNSQSVSQLNLGTLNLTGDPTFYNANGSVILSGNLEVQNDNIFIAASQNVIHSGGNMTSNGIGIVIIAGTKILPAAGYSIPPILPGQQNYLNNVVFTVGSPSKTGGEINLTGTPLLSSGSFSGLSSGEIELLAFAGSAPGSGTVIMPGVIQANGNSSLSSQSLSLLVQAGAPSGNSIIIGSIVGRPGDGVALQSTQPSFYNNLNRVTPVGIFDTPQAVEVNNNPGVSSGNINVGSITMNPISYFRTLTNGSVNLSADISSLLTQNNNSSSAPPVLIVPVPREGYSNANATQLSALAALVTQITESSELVIEAVNQSSAAASTIVSTDQTKHGWGQALSFFGQENLENKIPPTVIKSSIPAVFVGDELVQAGNASCIKSSTDSFQLNSGLVLFSPTHAEKIHLDGSTVNIASGSTVLISKTDGGESICNLADAKSGDVRVNFQGRTVILHPGQEFVVSGKSGSFESVNSLAFLGYRSLQNVSCSNGLAYLCEFPIINVLRFAQGNKNLNSAAHLSRILKEAACVELVTANHGPFKTGGLP